jgi:hypothetical protein
LSDHSHFVGTRLAASIVHDDFEQHTVSGMQLVRVEQIVDVASTTTPMP